MNFRFNPKKSAQAAATLLKLNGGDMDKYLFIKMLYLADREALQKWDEPITGDSAASMEYGPVLSIIYDLTKGDCPNLRKDWEPFVSDADPDANRIFLKADPGNDELSKAEIAILQSVHARFKDHTWKQMRDYCHSLPEFEDVGKKSKPLPPERILKGIGKTDPEILSAENRQKEIQVLEMVLAR